MKKSPTSKATLKQVADSAGVSVSTASRALTGKAREYRISLKTQKIVRDAAKKLNFRPSRVARALRLQRTNLIGVVVPDLANPFSASIAREITAAANEKGFSVLLADTRENTDIEEQLVDQFIDQEIEGLAICPVGLKSEHLTDVQNSGVPIIMVDRGFLNLPFPTVFSEHQIASEEATSILLENGHRHIGILQGIPGTLPNEERLAGIRNAYKTHNVEFDESFVHGDHFNDNSGYESAKVLMKKHPEMTAIFALSSQNGLGAMKAANENKIKVPDDLSIICFDEYPYSELLGTPMSTAAQDVVKLGQEAARLLIQQIETGETPVEKHHRVPVNIIQRASIAPAPVKK